MKSSVALLFLFITSVANAITWNVGATRTYTLPGQISALIGDGDTILIDGGVYNNDAVRWNKKDLVFIGLGSDTDRTVLRYSGDIPNGKGIFVFETPGICDNAYIENIVFDGAQVSDANGHNGAGVRFQAKDLRVNRCKFLNCQNGILQHHGSVTDANIIIENSEFENNGYQLPSSAAAGYEHSIYIGQSADTLIVTNCYFHDPRGQGNIIKTRAQRAFILYNLIDEGNGFGSWEINIAQGGLNIIMGNVIIQGSSGANYGMIGYDAATNVLEDFYFVNNTVINKHFGSIRYFNVQPSSGITSYKIYNNIFSSVPGTTNLFIGGNIPSSLDTAGNLLTSDYQTFGFVNPAMNNFQLTPTCTDAIDHAVSAGNTSGGFLLEPQQMYVDFRNAAIVRNVSGSAMDIGAYEFDQLSSEISSGFHSDFKIFPNPFHQSLHIDPGNSEKKYTIEVTDIYGKTIFKRDASTLIEIESEQLNSGLFLLHITSGDIRITKKIFKL
jgi:hypothetical protein